MNDQKLDKKVRKDAERVQKDLSDLAKDGAARLNRFEESVSLASSKTKKELTKQVESNVSQMSKAAGKLSGTVTKAVAGTIATMKKDVGHRLSHLKAQAQEVTVEVPKDLGKKAHRFPWIVITIGLAIGFLIGLLFLPTRQPVEQVQI